MKNSFLQLLLAVLMSMIGAKSFAHDIEAVNTDGVTIYYNWNNEAKTELAVSYRGDSYDSYSNEYSGNIVIPESVKYEDRIFQVTSIGVCAFRSCSGLTSVTIPNSVISLSQYAFDDTQWYDSQPDGLVYAGKFAYKYKGAMPSNTKITLLEGTIGIAGGAFKDCSNLISINMPNSIQSIGEWAFHGCSGLASITIPGNVTSIGMYTFWKCSALTSLTIPNSVKSISDWAFYGCSKLTSVTIGTGLTSISSNPFEHCPNLESIKVESGNKTYDSRNDCNAIVESNTNKLIVGCQKTLIPNTVTSIGPYAFDGCTNMTSMIIPNSVEEICDGAFEACTGLTSINIPEGVTSIGNFAFDYCSNLSSIIFPSTLTFIGIWSLVNTAWYKNQPDGLIYAGKVAYKYKGTMPDNTNINIAPGTVGIADNAFQDCYSRLASVTIPNSVISIGYGAFSGCNGLSTVTIPNSVKYIGGHAFFDCYGLTSISIGNSVTTIGEDAFYFCSRLTSITIPQSVNSIGRDAFYYCNRLTSMKVEDGNNVYDSRNNCNAIIEKNTNTLLFGCMNTIIPNSVMKIGKKAFYGCSYMTSLTIPSSVISIGEDAFTNCSGLTKIISEIQHPFILDYSVFGIPTSATFIVPNGAKQLYMTTKGWNHWKIIEAGESSDVLEKRIIHVGTAGTLPDLTTEYEKYAIEELKLTGEINGTDVKMLKYMPILKILDLSEVKIVQGGESYYVSEERDPYDWEERIYVPYYTKDNTISMCFFSNPLTSVILPRSVTSIESSAFSGCSGLTSVTIGNSVESISESAFPGCSGLTTIISEIEDPFAIDESVFECYDKDLYSTATLVVPLGKKSAYQSTAGWNKFQNIVEANGGGKEFEINGVRYLIGENNTVSVISKTEKYTGAVSIPSQVYYDGNNYTVTSIAQSAFEGCVDMTAVTIPSSVTTIGGAAFYYCTGLMTVDIPNGVKTIGEGAFSKCEGLTSVTIPGSVTSIGKNAFFQCYGLTQITSGIENPFAIDDGVFPTSVYNNASLLVPSGRKAAYQNTAGWKRFQNIVETSAVGKEFEANGVRYLIGENSTVSVTSKTGKYAGAVSIPSQVYYDGNNYTVTSIAQSAFEGCVDMTSVSIPGSVTTIGDAAFYYCTGLTTVDIPNGVKTIGEGAFSKCGGLTSVTIPSSVTSIGKNAFFQCYGLTQITSGIETPFAIDNGVFPTSVYNNASLLVPSGKKSAYQNTAGWKRFQNIYYVDGVYTLTYYVDGVEYKSATYSYGARIIPEAEPIKEGYTFSGWSYIPETMPAEEVNVTGYFTINQYTITYVIDGEEYATEMIDFGSKVDPPTPPSKDGFDFAWEEYPETMPAHDITINGAYTTTGILSIAVESGKAKIFTLDGRQVDAPQKGINIIRMDDGFIKKVVLGKEK